MKRLFFLLLVWLSACATAQELPRQVGYVRVPYVSGPQRNVLADAEQVGKQNGDGDLIIRDTQTGTQIVLFDADQADTVIDPTMSLDGQWVYFSLLRQRN